MPYPDTATGTPPPKAAFTPVTFIDGPRAGQTIDVSTDATGYVCSVPLDFSAYIQAAALPEPQLLLYRIDSAFVRFEGRLIGVRVAWSTAERPTQDTLCRHITMQRVAAEHDRLNPITVVHPGLPWTYYCSAAITMNIDDHATRWGTCQCGWLTERVPTRRDTELLALCDKHTADSLAGMQAHLATVRAGRIALTPEDAEMLEVLDIVDHANGTVDQHD